MKLQKGFSMVGLMAVVAIVAIIAVVSLPVYNQYIERTKVSKEIPVIGTYKNDIASCFMKNDSLDDCNDGESGIHPGLSNNGKILSLDVFEGNIVMIVDAQNHVENVEPVELMYIVNPNLSPVSSTLDWTLYCNDYSNDNNALVKECKGLITDKDGDGYDDSVEEEWGSDPLDPDSVPENWQALSPLYTDWTNNGGLNYTTGWEPPVSNQTSDFEQTRNYEQTQTRERTDREQDSFSGDIRVVDTVTETQTSTGQETRTVTVDNTSGGWVNSGSAYNCSEWTPSTSEYYETQMFEQTRSCLQDQENNYSYSIGGSFTDTKTMTVEETQEVEGTNALWLDNGGKVYAWGDTAKARNYTSNWEPEVNNQTNDFEQTRSYEQEQERLIEEQEENQLTGEVRVTNSTIETRVITGEETRMISVSIGNWMNSGNVYNCSAWTPEANTAYETQEVNQTRACSQNQEKAFSYSNGETYTDTQTISVTQERVVEGTQPLWVGISNSVSNWTNDGGRNYTNSWSPDVIGQTSDFTQTRSYTQEQERIISEREENQLTGEVRVVNSTTETQTVSGQESRNVVVTSTNWQNIGSVFSCSAWSPAVNTVDEGQTFTQSRDCMQEQEKTYTYSANNSSIGSMTINRDTQVNQERQATGTKPVWVSIDDSYGAWENVGSINYTTEWTPSFESKKETTGGYTQTRNYEQTQERTISQREENISTGEVRVVSTTTEQQTLNDTESRSVFGATTGWEISERFSCTDWSPTLSGQESDFLQTRNCDVEESLLYSYTLTETGESGSLTFDRTNTIQESQWVEVTSTAGGTGDGWSNWSTYNTSCGSWGPATNTVNQGQNFTQTRSCTDYQERFKYFVVGGQVVDSDRDTRTTSRTESRSATGTKAVSGSWVQVGFYDARTGQTGTLNGGSSSSGSTGSTGRVVDQRTYNFAASCTLNDSLVAFLPMGGQNYGIYFYYECR